MRLTLLVLLAGAFCRGAVVHCVSGDLVQDDWSCHKEVTSKDMASDEEYDSNTVYGE